MASGWDGAAEFERVVAASSAGVVQITPMLFGIGAILGVLVVVLTFMVWNERGKLNFSSHHFPDAQVRSPEKAQLVDRLVTQLSEASFAGHDMVSTWTKKRGGRLGPTAQVPDAGIVDAWLEYAQGIEDLEQGDEPAIAALAEALIGDIDRFVAAQEVDNLNVSKAHVIADAAQQVMTLPEGRRAAALRQAADAYRDVLGTSDLSVHEVEERLGPSALVFATRAIDGFVPFQVR